MADLVIPLLVRFAFEKDNIRRKELCEAFANDTKEIEKDCKWADNKLNSLKGWCDSEDKYLMSWFFIAHSIDEIKNLSFFEDGSNFSLFGSNFDDDSSKWIPNALNVSKHFQNINDWLGEGYTLGFEFVRQFLLSNLLLNNFGRSARQTQYLIDEHCLKGKRLGIGMMHIECNENRMYLRELGTLGISDFDPILTFEWLHNSIHIVLIFLATITNLYTCHCSKRSVRRLTSSTSRQLFCLLLFANIVFISSNIWLLVEQHHPIIPEENCAEFVSRQDYDGDLWPDVVFFANIGTFRMIKYDRYVSKNANQKYPTTKAILATILLIMQNLFMNLSRTISVMVLLCIMCFVFYELRMSFHGKTRYKISRWLYATFIGVLSLISFIYILMGISQYKVIDKINLTINNFRHFESIDTHKNVCMDSQNNFPLETFFIKFHALFTLFAHVFSALALLLLLCYHETKMITMEIPFTSGSLAEMRKGIHSLICATIVYILSNIGLTIVEVRIMISDCKNSNECIVDLSYSYHWLYLACLVDPIVQPIIILFRIKAMKNYHNYVVKKWQRFELTTFIKHSIIYMHKKLRKRANRIAPDDHDDNLRPTIAVNIHPTLYLKKMATKSNFKRPNMHEPREIDSELENALWILEEERNKRK